MHYLKFELDRWLLTLARSLDLRVAIVANETVPKLVIGIPLGDVAFVFRRVVATKGLERALAQAVQVNVCAALLQARAGLEYLQPRQLVASEPREPVVDDLVLDC